MLGVVRTAVAIGPHLLEQLQPVALDALGHRLAGQAVVLMAANALNLHMAVVEEEAFILVKADGAEAEAVRLAFHCFLSHHDHGFQRVQMGTVDIPQRRVGHFAPLMKGGFFPGGNFDGIFQCKDLIPGGVSRYGTHHGHGGLVPVVAQGRIHRHIPPARSLALRVNEHTVKVHRHRLGLDEPHRAVDPRALVPPALVFADINVQRHHVLLPEVHHVGHVHLKRVVAAVVGEHIATVDVHLAVNANALEIQTDTAALVGGVQREMLAVPRVFVAEETQCVVVFFFGLLSDDIVVGHVHGKPRFVGDQVGLVIELRAVHIFPGGGAAALAGRLGFDIHRGFQLGFLQRDISQMKTPVLVE